jgi:hypothetical protein
MFTWMQELFGTGLGNKSFGGLPIDSNWWLPISNWGRPLAGPRRAIALFLIVNA